MKARDQAIDIADLHVAADGIDPAVCKRLDQMPDRVGQNDRVTVDRDDVFGRGFGESEIERGVFAAVGLGQQSDAQIVAGQLRHDGGRVVGAAVVDHQYDQIIIIALEHRFDRARDDFGLVIRRDQHRDRRRKFRQRFFAPSGQRDHDEQKQRAQERERRD